MFTRKYLPLGFLAFLFLIVSGCGAGKAPLTEAEWNTLEELAATRNFTFVANTVEPTTGRGRSNINNVGYLKMQGDQVQMELGYVGQRQVNQVYGRTEGMRYEGAATEIKTTRNEGKNYYNLDFILRNKSELLQCNLRFLSEKQAILTINSNQRSSIRYQGEIKR